MKILVWYLVSSFVFEMMVSIVIILGISHNTSWISHVFPPLEYLLFAVIFSKWQKNIYLKKAYIWSIFLIAAFSIVNLLFFQSVAQGNTYGMSIQKLLLISMSAAVLLELNKEGIYPLTREYRFWVAAAVLFYNLTTLMMFSLANLILSLGEQFSIPIFMTHMALSIITYLIYTKGFLCRPQGQKSG
ncbi:MAG: hypothetical protein HZB59_11620 [Ignavibacteriales bacterium]|nr:hypothetical protein [Ignavibacteriales bacterium]